MIPLEALRAVRVVIAHGYPDGPCPDGLAGAMVLQDVLPHAEIRFSVLNTSAYEALPADPHMLFVDMVPPESRLDEFVAAGAIVLDHHKNNRDAITRFGERGVFADEVTEPGVSGALLAFEHVWLPFWRELFMEPFADAANVGRVRAFAELVGVRDTWQQKDPRWRAACAQSKVLRFFPPEDWLDGDPLNESRLTSRISMLGEVLMRKDDEQTKQLLASAFPFQTPRGTRVVVLPSTYVSDAATAIGDEADVVIGFNFRLGRGHVPDLRLSFRSRGARDVAAIAKTLGGGGHTNAAGAAVSLTLGGAIDRYEDETDPHDESTSRNPYTMIQRIMAAF